MSGPEQKDDCWLAVVYLGSGTGCSWDHMWAGARKSMTGEKTMSTAQGVLSSHLAADCVICRLPGRTSSIMGSSSLISLLHSHTPSLCSAKNVKLRKSYRILILFCVLHFTKSGHPPGLWLCIWRLLQNTWCHEICPHTGRQGDVCVSVSGWMSLPTPAVHKGIYCSIRQTEHTGYYQHNS